MASPTIDARSVSRRSLARGVAWAAPVIVAASAVPAYAASSCVHTLTISGGLVYRWGTIGSPSTTQSLDVGTQAYVRNLPGGVAVTRVSYQWWVANRIGQTSAGPGAFWVGNGTYTENNTGCRDFSTGPSGRFRIDYSGVTALRNCPSPEGRMPNFVYVTATLSNGQEPTYAGVSDGGSDCG